MKRSGFLLFSLGLLLLPLFAQAQGPFSGAYIGRFTTQERTAETENTEQQMRFYNRIILRYEPSQSFAVRTALRRADFIQEETGSTHLYYAYANWKPLQSLDFTLGRQYPYNKLIRHAVDGISGEWKFLTHWSIEGLWGVFAPADRAGIIDEPEDEHGSYVALKYRNSSATAARVALFQEITGGRIQNYLSADGRYPDLYGFTLAGFFKYNLKENVLQEAEGQLRREVGERLVLTGDVKYRDPGFDLPEWYWQFSVDPYSTARIGLDYWLTNTGSITAEYFSRLMSERTIQRYRLGWLALNWSLGVVYAADDDNSTSEWNAYGSIQYRFGSNLVIGAGANYFDYIFNEEYEEPLNAYGGQLFARYRLFNALTAGVRGYYLVNPEFSQDVRLLGELSYRF